MWKWHPPDPADERFKGMKVVVLGNQIWIEPGPAWKVHDHPKPGRPIPEADET